MTGGGLPGNPLKFCDSHASPDVQMKKVLIGVLAMPVLLWLTAIVFVKLKERTLIFHAEKAVGPLKEPAPPFQPPHERVSFASADGTPLVGWVVPSASADSSGVWVLVCHGNSHNLSQFEEPEFYSYLRALGVNILTFDYRGFGESGGEPSEDGAYADTRAAYDLVVSRYGVNPKQVIIYGHSLGTGMAVQLASSVEAGALVLQAPYTSVPDMGARRYPYLPIHSLATYTFPSLERMARVTEPLLVLHSPADSTIPVAMGELIHRAAASPIKRFMHIAGGHNIAFKVDSALFFRAFREMIGTVRAASSTVAGPADSAAMRVRGTRG